MVKLINRIFRLKPNETGLVLVMGFALLTNAMALNLADVVAVSGFLGEVGVSYILYVWIADMVLIALTAGLQSLIVDRFNRVRLIKIIALIIMLAYLALRLLFLLGAPAWLNYAMLYILAEQQGLFFPIVFWVLASDIFDAPQARRLFPLISSWAFTGQILGLALAAVFPLMAGYLAVSAVDLLVLNGGLFVVVYALLHFGLRRVKIRPTSYGHETVKETLTEGWGFVREVMSFRYLMLSMTAVFVVLTIFDYHFLAMSEQTAYLANTGDFQTFYASFHLVVTLAAIGIQSLLTSRIIEKLTLKNSFFVLPSVLTASVAAMLAAPGLVSATLGLGVSYLTRDTLDESAQKSLQALVPEERRGRVSLFMDSYLYAVGTILGCLVTGAVVLLAASQNLVDYYMYLALAGVFSLLALGAIYKMHRVYDISLLSWRLRRRRRRASVSSINRLIDL
jgi:MFS family permease